MMRAGHPHGWEPSRGVGFGGEVKDGAGVVGHPEDEHRAGHRARHREGDGGESPQQKTHVPRLVKVRVKGQ